MQWIPSQWVTGATHTCYCDVMGMWQFRYYWLRWFELHTFNSSEHMDLGSAVVANYSLSKSFRYHLFFIWVTKSSLPCHNSAVVFYLKRFMHISNIQEFTQDHMFDGNSEAFTYRTAQFLNKNTNERTHSHTSPFPSELGRLGLCTLNLFPNGLKPKHVRHTRMLCRAEG